MRLLYIILVLSSFLFWFGCSEGGGGSSETATSSASIESDSTDDTEEEEETEDTEEEEIVVIPDESVNPVFTQPITLTLLSDKLYFKSGEFVEMPNIKPTKCGERCFTDGNEKVFYNPNGSILRTEVLEMVPSFVNGDWIVENIEPVRALALGARYKNYTKYYYQGAEFGNWMLNEYKVTDLIKTNTGEVVAIGEGYHVLTSDKIDVNHADKLLIHMFNSDVKYAKIDNVLVTWFTNYFNKAKQWIFYDDTWYSWNGYEFSTYLSEFANVMHGWNVGEYPITVLNPTVIKIGVHQNKLLWLECNTGWVIAFDPAYNDLTPLFQLYLGDGLRLSGIDKSLSLNLVLIDSDLYFFDGGSRVVNIDSRIVQFVFAGGGRFEKW